MAAISVLLELKDKLTGKLKGLSERMEATKNKFQGQAGDMVRTHREAMQKMKAQVPVLGGTLDLLTNKYVLMGTAVTAAGGIIAKSVSIANDWDKKMAQLNVTAQMNRGQLDQLSDKFESIGEHIPVAVQNIPLAFNKIISSGLSTQTSLKALEPTLMAAKAGFVDVELAAGALSSVMASAKKDDPTETFNVLFATLNKGNVSFQNIAAYMPKIIPIASQVGKSLEETAGAYAYLTAQGLPAEAATTALINTFNALSNDKIKDNFKKIGVSFYDSGGKMRDLVAIAEDLKKAMAGLSDAQRNKKFGSLGLDQQSTLGLSVLMNNVAQLKETIGATTESAGALKDAFTNSATPLDDWQIVLNLAHNLLEEIGGVIVQSIQPPLQWIKDHLYEIKLFIRGLVNYGALDGRLAGFARIYSADHHSSVRL